MGCSCALMAQQASATGNNETCVPEQFDLVFVLDSSGSVGPEDWESSKRFAANVVNGLDIEAHGIQ